MADLEGKFVGSFLRQLDASDALIVDVFGLSEMMVDSLDSFQTSLFDSFLDGLHEEEYGNIFYEILDTSGAKHTITLNYSSRPSRHAGGGKLESIKSECEAVKEKVICNIKENVEEQSQKCSIVEFSSAFHMIRKIGKES